MQTCVPESTKEFIILRGVKRKLNRYIESSVMTQELRKSLINGAVKKVSR